MISIKKVRSSNYIIAKKCFGVWTEKKYYFKQIYSLKMLLQKTKL